MANEDLEAEVYALADAFGLLLRRIRAVSSASNELSVTENAVLVRLEKEGPATTADLARAHGMKPQSMGATVAALAEAGLVARKPHPTDGRQVMIELTAKGTALRKSTRAAKRTWLVEAVGRLNREDQKRLFAASDILRRVVES